MFHVWWGVIWSSYCWSLHNRAWLLFRYYAEAIAWAIAKEKPCKWVYMCFISFAVGVCVCVVATSIPTEMKNKEIYCLLWQTLTHTHTTQTWSSWWWQKPILFVKFRRNARCAKCMKCDRIANETNLVEYRIVTDGVP